MTQGLGRVPRDIGPIASLDISRLTAEMAGVIKGTGDRRSGWDVFSSPVGSIALIDCRTPKTDIFF